MSPGATRPDARPTAAARVLLVLLATGLALGLGELAARWFGPSFQVVFGDTFQLSENPILEYELRPGAVSGRMKINADGLRDRRFPLAKPAGVFRIGAIGDSITFGLGCAAYATFPKRLEALLVRHASPGAPHFEVINFGVTGYNVSQIVERLRTVGLGYSLDSIVYGYSLNDPQARGFEGEVARQLRGGSRGPLSRLLSRSQLFVLARHRFGAGERDEPRPLSEEAAALLGGRGSAYLHALHTEAEPARRFREGLAELARLARAGRTPVLLAIFPLFDAQGTQAVPKVQALIAEEARRRELRAFDLEPAFRAAGARFERGLAVDPMHPSCFGHHVAAVALLRELVAAEIVPPGSVDLAGLEAGNAVESRIARALAGSGS